MKNNNFKKIWIITISFIILISVFFFGWFLNIQYQKIIVTKYPYIDFSRNFIDQKNFITNIQPLRDKVKEMAKDFGIENISIYIEFLNTGANISINPDKYIWPASLSKLPTALAVMKKTEDGVWSLDNELVLMEQDIDRNSGVPDNLIGDNKIGTRFSIESLLEASLRNSDNTAHEILSRNISKDELHHVMDAVGLERLFTPDGKVSAKEYSRLFRILFTASFLNRENSQKILSWLDGITFTKFLASGVPEYVSFSHKYGENLSYAIYADSGIVYLPNKPYLISVMVQGNKENNKLEEEKKCGDFISSISKVTYDFFKNN